MNKTKEFFGIEQLIKLLKDPKKPFIVKEKGVTLLFEHYIKTGGITLSESEFLEDFMSIYFTKNFHKKNVEMTEKNFNKIVTVFMKPIKFLKISEKLKRNSVRKNMIKSLIIVLKRKEVVKVIKWKALECIAFLIEKSGESTEEVVEIVKDFCEILRFFMNDKNDNELFIYNILKIIRFFSALLKGSKLSCIYDFGYDLLLRILENGDYGSVSVQFSVNIIWNLSERKLNKLKSKETVQVLFMMVKSIIENNEMRKKIIDFKNDLLSIILLLVNNQECIDILEEYSTFIFNRFDFCKETNYVTIVLISNFITHLCLLNKKMREKFIGSKHIEKMFLYLDVKSQEKKIIKRFTADEIKEIWLSILSILFVLVSTENKNMFIEKYVEKLFNFFIVLKDRKLQEKTIGVLLQCAKTDIGNLILDETECFSLMIRTSTDTQQSIFIRTQSIAIVSSMLSKNQKNKDLYHSHSGIKNILNLIIFNMNKTDFISNIIDSLENAIIGHKKNFEEFLKYDGFDLILKILMHAVNNLQLTFFILGFILNLVNYYKNEPQLKKAMKQKATLITFLLRLFKKENENKEYNFRRRIFLIFKNIEFSDMNYLTFRERAVLTEIKPYEKYIELEIWNSIKSELEKENIVPIKENIEMLQNKLKVLEELRIEIENENKKIKKEICEEEIQKENRFFDSLKEKMRKEKQMKRFTLSRNTKRRITNKFLFYTYFSKIK